MELFFNILWCGLAIVCLSQWLRAEQRQQRDRRTTLVAWVMLVVILFPVISVSDDLWAIQNPAEADSFARRDSHAAAPQSLHHATAGLPEDARCVIPFVLKGRENPMFRSEPGVGSRSRGSIQNRPPPRA